MARIAIDIDDTLTDSSKVVREYALLYDSKYSNEKILINRLDTILRGFFDHEAIVNFYLDYGIEMSNKAQVKPDACKVIDKLNYRELEAVIAHELSHIKNYDIMLSAVISVMAGFVVMLSDILFRSRIRGDRDDDNDSGKVGVILMLMGLIFLILCHS